MRSPMMRVSPPAVTTACLKPRALQNLDAAIDRVALADAAQVDAHARVLEAHGVVRRVEQHVAPVHRRQRRLDLRLGRVDVLR